MKTISKILIFVLLAALAACMPSVQQVGDAASTLQAQITYVPVTWTPDVNTIVAQTFAAMTAQAGEQVAPMDTATPSASAPGSISGNLSYPSSFIPPLRVVAFSVFDQTYRYVDTQQNQGTYQIPNLPPGKYHVVAYVIGGEGATGGLSGGYSQMVPCGLSVTCTDHSLIDVVVLDGADTPNINPGDWYAPADAFPPMPNADMILPTATDSGPQPLTGNGGLAGKIQYPSSGIPPLMIVAFKVNNPSEYYSITTSANQSTYEMSLPPGQYYVVAYTLDGTLAGGYTQAVPCGLTVDCADHSLIAVQVSSKVVLNGDVNLFDWYAPAGTFPPKPIP